jgi:hypothetical protein
MNTTGASRLIDEIRHEMEQHEAELKPGRKAYHERALKECQIALRIAERIHGPVLHAKAERITNKLAREVGHTPTNGNGNGRPPHHGTIAGNGLPGTLTDYMVGLLARADGPLTAPQLVDQLDAAGWHTLSANKRAIVTVMLQKLPGKQRAGKVAVGNKQLTRWTLTPAAKKAALAAAAESDFVTPAPK